MISMLQFLGRHATAVMASGVFIGLAAQPLAAVLRPLIFPAVWALLMFSMMRLDAGAVMAVLRRPGRLLLVLVLMLCVSPLAMWGVVSLVPLADGLKAALILTAGSSPLMSTPAIAMILALDGALALAVLIAATLLIPFTLPVTALILLGLDLGTDAGQLMLRLAGLVGSAALVAFGVQKLFGRRRIEDGKVGVDGVFVILLLVFAIGLMDGITPRLFAEPLHMLFVTALSFAVYIGLMVLAAVLFAVLWHDRPTAFSVGLAFGCRNLAIIIAVLPAGADPDIMTYFALAQFPIYIMPSLLKPVIGRILKNRTVRHISADGGPS